jgi:UDP-N-acetylglucosamine 2-epimerase (hydrolysing)|tara:strand:- start:3490 stop:4635 length:1146 start_codon:yes stop_codon:yes gene_type:complete
MISTKKIIFVTSTRADFGKLKSLIRITKKKEGFKVYIVVTGMHMIGKFGNTYREVEKVFKKDIIKFRNQSLNDRLELILTKTTKKFSNIVKRLKPDLIVIHGDRVEALSCALVGSLNHILTAHIEGGEVSGTIDDTIRHALTKLSHIHFVGSKIAYKRVLNMGEEKKSIFTIGSPDLDIILKKKLPSINYVKKRYSIKFKNYLILLWHPVTSKVESIKKETIKLTNFLKKLNKNTIVIYPNNDPGCNQIINIYNNLKNKHFKIIKNLRFENFLSLLKNSDFIIGNSSSAIYEAPMFNVPAINIGDRQYKRLIHSSIKNFEIEKLELKGVTKFLNNYKKIRKTVFGNGNSDKKFIKILKKKSFWETSKQKFFSEVNKNAFYK